MSQSKIISKTSEIRRQIIDEAYNSILRILDELSDDQLYKLLSKIKCISEERVTQKVRHNKISQIVANNPNILNSIADET